MQVKTEMESPNWDTTLNRCLVDGDAAANVRDRRRRRKALGISFAVELVVLALLIGSPLMTSVARPDFTTSSKVRLAFDGSATPSEAQRQPSTIHRAEKFLGHPIMFAMNPAAHTTAPRPEEGDAPPISGASPDGSLSAPEGILITGLQPITTPVQPPGEVKKSVEKHPEKISEPVQQAQLISRTEPRYPPLALQARKEGAVLLHAIISREGRITELQVVSGSPWFVQAALEAVGQWRYRPTILDGETVEVETSITVIFRLS